MRSTDFQKLITVKVDSLYQTEQGQHGLSYWTSSQLIGAAETLQAHQQ